MDIGDVAQGGRRARVPALNVMPCTNGSALPAAEIEIADLFGVACDEFAADEDERFRRDALVRAEGRSSRRRGCALVSVPANTGSRITSGGGGFFVLSHWRDSFFLSVALTREIGLAVIAGFPPHRFHHPMIGGLRRAKAS